MHTITSLVSEDGRIVSDHAEKQLYYGMKIEIGWVKLSTLHCIMSRRDLYIDMFCIRLRNQGQKKTLIMWSATCQLIKSQIQMASMDASSRNVGT
jgi:hypothetical protein